MAREKATNSMSQEFVAFSLSKHGHIAVYVGCSFDSLSTCDSLAGQWKCKESSKVKNVGFTCFGVLLLTIPQ